MVQHALAFTDRVLGPAESRLPANLVPVVLNFLLGLAVHEQLPILVLGNLDRASLGRRREGDIGLGPIVDVGHDRHAFGPSVESLGNSLSGVSTRREKWDATSVRKCAREAG